MKKKILVPAVASLMLMSAMVGGTLAYLYDTTEEVENVFTVGDVDIDLTETTTDYKMVPGNTIAKDPTVTVLADSEACWLFVKIEESDNLDDFITYEVADGWTELAGEIGVYYREVEDSETNAEFAVLKDDQVTVKTSVTKAMMDDVENDKKPDPTLTFTAYAIQKANIADAETAWDEIHGESEA